MRRNKIVIISSGQPAGNPRMTKEALALAAAGFKVTVIYSPMSPWGDEFDKSLFRETLNISWRRVGAHSTENPFIYLVIRLRRKIWEHCFCLFGNICDAAIKASGLYSQDLLAEALKHKADLYIGHNLGAIRAVVMAAKKFNSKSCFDFEDFHRGDGSKTSLHYRLVKSVEDYYTKSLDLAYAASPLITHVYSELYPTVNFETINNYFSLKYRVDVVRKLDLPLKLFWFSQYIGQNRGLEQIINAIGLVKEKNICFTLLGNISKSDKDYFRILMKQANIEDSRITFIPPVDAKTIFEIASSHHIGFAAEPARDVNNNIALANKIFTYLLAGNAIIFSDTDAQRLFFNKHSNIGLLYSNGNVLELADKIMLYYENPELLRSHRQNAWDLSQILNWENESQKLLRIIKSQIFEKNFNYIP